MRMPRLARWMGGLALASGLAGCVVHDTPAVNPSYGDGYGNYTRGAPGASVVGEPEPAYVSGMPPEPLYEQMSDSPGDGAVWIDGYWHWNGYEWVWAQGRWEREQPGYVYVEPSYDYSGEQYVYTPGYWSLPDRAPRGWQVRDHRDGRPTVVAPPIGSGGYRPPIATGTRHPVGAPGTIYRPPGRPIGGARVPAGAPPVYDPRGGATWRPPPRRTSPAPTGVFDGPATAGGAIGGPARGGTIYGNPGNAPSAPVSAPPPVAVQPTVQPAPVQVFTPASPGNIGHPLGTPIYVNPGDAQRSNRPLGTPTYVNPTGPAARPFQPAPAPTRVQPSAPVHVAPPPPPPPPPPAAPGPRSTTNPRQRQ